MRIKILVDNTAISGFESVHGFSLLIEADKKILFDLGPNELFIENAAKLGEDLTDVETVVLSHGHWDHGDGLAYLKGKQLILHPDSFTRRSGKINSTNVGLSISRETIQKNYEILECKEPFWISDNIVFLGEIPRENDFESKESSFVLPDGSADFVLDDSAIVIQSKKGLIVISGCAHSGICNTVTYAQQVCNNQKVYAVLGGFHLRKLDEVTKKTIEFLCQKDVKFVGPTHCTGFKVRDEFKKYLEVIDLNAGNQIEL